MTHSWEITKKILYKTAHVCTELPVVSSSFVYLHFYLHISDIKITDHTEMSAHKYGHADHVKLHNIFLSRL